MVNLTLAISLFVLSHLIPSLPGVRPTLIRLMGRNGYLATYGALSLVLLGWVLHAAISAPLVLVWLSTGWQAWITLIVSPLGLFLIIAGLVSVNPLSLSARRHRQGRTPGAVVAITRHPVFWGLALWGASHIPPNGDVRSLMLFGTVAVLALSATQSLSRTELKETDRYTGRTQARLGRMQPSSGVTGGWRHAHLASRAPRAHAASNRAGKSRQREDRGPDRQ